MKWFARFLGWASLFAIPSFLLMKPYQSALAHAAMAILTAALKEPIRLNIGLHEPFNLGIYAAMCLASVRSPLRKRIQAIAVGVPTLALFVLLVVVAVIGGYHMLTAGQGGAADGALIRFILFTTETIPWISAPVLWLMLLGVRELPRRMLR